MQSRWHCWNVDNVSGMSQMCRRHPRNIAATVSKLQRCSPDDVPGMSTTFLERFWNIDDVPEMSPRLHQNSFKTAAMQFWRRSWDVDDVSAMSPGCSKLVVHYMLLYSLSFSMVLLIWIWAGFNRQICGGNCGPVGRTWPATAGLMGNHPQAVVPRTGINYGPKFEHEYGRPLPLPIYKIVHNFNEKYHVFRNGRI